MIRDLINFLPHSMAIMEKSTYANLMGNPNLQEMNKPVSSFMEYAVKSQQCVYLLKNFISLSIVKNLTPYDPPDVCEILIFCDNKKTINLIDEESYTKEQLTKSPHFSINFTDEEKQGVIERVYTQYNYINNGEAEPFKINISFLDSLVRIFKDDKLYVNDEADIFKPYFNALESGEIIDFLEFNDIIPKALDKYNDKAYYFLTYAIQESYPHIDKMLMQPRIMEAFNSHKDDILNKLIYLGDAPLIEQFISSGAASSEEIKMQLIKIMDTTAMVNYRAQIESCWLKFNLETKEEKLNKRVRLGL